MNQQNTIPMNGMPTSIFCTPPMHGSGGMTMYMDGFQSSLMNSSSKPCLNFYIYGWTLDTQHKFIFAMAVIICLGISVDGLAWLKRRYISSLEGRNKRTGRDDDYNILLSTQTKVKLSMFQFFQALLGYVLMLSAMTYSIELLFSAMIGLTLGSHIFRNKKHDSIFSMKIINGVVTSSLSPTSGILDQLDENEDSPCHDTMGEYMSFISSAVTQQRRNLVPSSKKKKNFDYSSYPTVKNNTPRSHDTGDIEQNG